MRRPGAPDGHQRRGSLGRRRSTCAAPGLGQVVEELLDFAGCDLHVVHRPEGRLDVRVDRPALRQCQSDRADAGRRDHRTRPPPDVETRTGGPTDPDRRRRGGPRDPADRAPPSRGWPRLRRSAQTDDTASQHLLVIGWNGFGAELLANWATFATPESTVDIVVDASLCDVDGITVAGLDPRR
jgi:hypothetical protein